MTSRPKDTAIIIPARNEVERIGSCLSALAGQMAGRTTVVMVINNTSDGTKAAARHAANSAGLDLDIVDCVLPPREGVGTARRAGCGYAISRMPNLRYMLTTDADCLVAPDWVAQNLEHLREMDAVCGRIDLIADEMDVLKFMDQKTAASEGIYRKLVQELYGLCVPAAVDYGDTHGEAAGASLAFRKSAYLAVGGFENVACGEDRRIVRAMRSAGQRVLHADDVVVRASCRLSGRASGGMSDALKDRIGGTGYLIDDCLPDADWLVENTVSGNLGAWPPHVPSHRRVNARDLPANIKTLQKFMMERRTAVARSTLTASAEAVSRLPTAASLSIRGSAIVPADPTIRFSRMRVLTTRRASSAFAQLNRRTD